MENNDYKVLNFLRALYDKIRGEFKEIALLDLAKSYNVPQYCNYCEQLIKKEIILRKKHGRGYLYKWNDPSGPTLLMVQLLIKAVSDMWKKSDKKEIPAKKSSPPAVTNAVKEAKSMLNAEVKQLPDKINLSDLPESLKNLTLYSLIEFCKEKNIKMTIEI